MPYTHKTMPRRRRGDPGLQASAPLADPKEEPTSAEPVQIPEVLAEQLRERYRRVSHAEHVLREELEQFRLLMYAWNTQDDPEILAGMEVVSAHVESGQPFEGALPVEDFVKGTRRRRGA